MRFVSVLAAAVILQAASASSQDSETRIPEAAWETRFEGLYAVDGRCERHDAVWALARGSVTMGRVSCLGMGKRVWIDGALVVPLSRCRYMAEDRPDLRLSFRPRDDGTLDVSGDEVSAHLVPCPSR